MLGSWSRRQYTCIARIRSVMNGPTDFKISPPSSNQTRGFHLRIIRINSSAHSFGSVFPRHRSRTHRRASLSIPNTMCTV